MKVWAVHTGKLLYSCRGHYGEVTMIAINEGNTTIASADAMGSVQPLARLPFC